MERSFDRKTVIARDGDHFIVSTVSLPASIFGFVFETMVFRCSPDGEVESYSDLYCQRYDMRDEAEAGHVFATETFQL